jgi:hypothetical protein
MTKSAKPRPKKGVETEKRFERTLQGLTVTSVVTAKRRIAGYSGPGNPFICEVMIRHPIGGTLTVDHKGNGVPRVSAENVLEELTAAYEDPDAYARRASHHVTSADDARRLVCILDAAQKLGRDAYEAYCVLENEVWGE